jgi:tRNA(fMet)-specific endonuclease VapC
VKYLLDTNACIHVLNADAPAVVEKLREHRPSDIVLSSVVKAELLHGARRSHRIEDNLQLLQKFFEPFSTLPFDDRAAEEYGLIRADLERAGTPIGPNDLLIAASARAHDLTLVSNVKEFSRVVGLRLEDWQTPSEDEA